MLTKTETSFSVLFTILVIAELVCGSINSLAPFHYVTKPLILVALIMFFWKQSHSLNNKVRTITLTALLFSLFGDVSLMFIDKSANFFIGGLVAFLLAHVMYILVFLSKRNTKRVVTPFTFVLIVYATGLFYVLKDYLGDLLIPVILYMLVILIMVISSSLRKGTVANLSYNLVIIGAVFFLISDSFLAVNKFYQPIPFSNIIIMLTYAIAQYLIVMGILKQQN